MKCLNLIFISVLFSCSINVSYTQEINNNHTPEFIDWPCFYIESKPETWNLERHSTIYQALGKNVFKMEWQVTLSGGIKYTLEGKSSGAIIKASDAYSFLLQVNIEEMKGEIELERTVAKELGISSKEQEEKVIRKYECKLYKLKVDGESRTFRDTDKQIECSMEALPDNTVKIVPATKLKKGEYAFFYKDSYAFTFKIVD